MASVGFYHKVLSYESAGLCCLREAQAPPSPRAAAAWAPHLSASDCCPEAESRGVEDLEFMLVPDQPCTLRLS